MTNLRHINEIVYTRQNFTLPTRLNIRARRLEENDLDRLPAPPPTCEPLGLAGSEHHAAHHRAEAAGEQAKPARAVQTSERLFSVTRR
jgi:hypothetical protein